MELSAAARKNGWEGVDKLDIGPGDMLSCCRLDIQLHGGPEDSELRKDDVSIEYSLNTLLTSQYTTKQDSF